MNPMQAAVQKFHEAMGVTIGTSPAIRDAELRVRIIEEEANETTEAIRNGDLVGAIDGLCDLIYVALGTAVTFGINLQPFFDEVQRSNMTKLWPDGKSYKRADGKVLKPPTFQSPRIKEMLSDLFVQAEAKP